MKKILLSVALLAATCGASAQKYSSLAQKQAWTTTTTPLTSATKAQS